MSSEPGREPERASRKDDHVRLAMEQRAHRGGHNEFDDLEFIHHALDGVSAHEVSLETRVGEWTWSAPFYINGMTGGTKLTGRINRGLAIAAREAGVAMACGSMSVALDDPEAAESFTVIRDEHPDGFVMANIGAGRSADDARRAVEMLGADALQLHVNPVQETAMPEGTRDFSEWYSGLERIVSACPVPVIVKEVGFGLSRRTLSRLHDIGVAVADVSGSGGTDFLSIENARGAGSGYAMLSGFGQSAPACLLDAPATRPVLLASGGVRTPFDVVKALALGASAVGVAGAFLTEIVDGDPERLIKVLRTWDEQTRAILALLGSATPGELTRTDLLVRGRLAEFCRLRGIDLAPLSERSASSPV